MTSSYTSFLGYVSLLLSSIFSALASVLLKLSTVSNEDVGLFILNKNLSLKLMAIGAYGLGFLCYAWSLKYIELQAAYPIMVAITILLLFFYGYLMEKTISPVSILGAGFIVIGIGLVFIKAK